MSTRRARIKAITSVPVRRKNVESNENSKNRQSVVEAIEKEARAPQSPSGALQKQEDEQYCPVIKTASPVCVSSEATSVIICTPPKEKLHPNDVKVSIVESPPRTSTPPRAEKVSVITPNLNYKPNPLGVSPSRSHFASPYVPSPKITAKAVGVIVQAPNTPLKVRTPAAHTIDENNELQISSKAVNSVVYNSVSSKSAVSDDYNLPSLPESVDNDGVMDGIVPLQAESNVPKPIDLLKNEIISENAEVLFDPIIPLPSPSKVRPKLRPTPRLGPHRRNSTVGSASESDDESRRALHGGASTPGLTRQRRDSQSSVPNRDPHRTRNDSVCSSVSQINGQASTSSPVKEKASSKSRRKEAIRRMAALRRRKDSMKRESLTMFDLIFYNPTTNPIVPDQDEVKAKEENKKDEEEKAKAKEEKKSEPEEAPAAEDSTPVPQIKLGPNGEIVIDKSSLVIKQTEARRAVSVVREGAWGAWGAGGAGGGGGRYSRAARSADWAAGETVRFYRALAAIGTDFSLMAPLFPDRTRRELKLKFKKEEKINGAQVDKALRAGNSWDPNRLKAEFQSEREEAARQAKREAKKLKLEKLAEKQRMKKARELRIRNSRASKALQSTMLPGASKQKDDDILTANDIVNRAIQAKKGKDGTDSEEDSHPTTSIDIIPTPPMATLTLVNNGQTAQNQTKNIDNMATLTRVNTPTTTPPLNLNAMPNIPSNIETGSLVVLTVNDPSSPSKKMLQTYIAHSAGKLTPVALPPTFLNSVVGYMKKGTPKSTLSSSSSPQLMSPSSVASHDSRTGASTPVLNHSPVKRKRISSYTITQL